jgi:aminopeptidase N
MLGRLRRQYEYKTLTTDQFRAVVAEALPPQSFDPQLEGFFEDWVYSTGIPTLKMSHSVRGKGSDIRVTGTITQSDVPEDFSIWVPIEIQLPKGEPVVHWIRTATGSVPFSVPLRQTPVKVQLDPNASVLHR